MSQNQNGISIRFFKPKLKPEFYLLNCLPAAAEGVDEVCGEGADAEGDAHLDGGDHGGRAAVGLERLHDLAQEDAEGELDPPN